MPQIKDYSGSVYGGLGQLLYDYCHIKQLAISPQLENVQNVERFGFDVWRELLSEIEQHNAQPALGLDIAQYVKPQHLGIMAYIALSSDTLAEALTRYHEYHRLIYDGSPLKIEQQENSLSIRWGELPAHLTTQITDEIAIALLVQFLRLYLSVPETPIIEVHFRSPRPKSTLIYERFFQCKVKFSQANAEIFLNTHFLNSPLQQADHTLQKLLMQQAQNLLNRLPNSTQLDERLQQAILVGVQKNNYQIEYVAQQLSISVRQLQRYLQQQNSTYQQRVQEIREVLAIQYLTDPHLSLHEIALLLGYSEQSAFQRAFKQWMGITPQKWRLKQTHQAEYNSSDF